MDKWVDKQAVNKELYVTEIKSFNRILGMFGKPTSRLLKTGSGKGKWPGVWRWLKGNRRGALYNKASAVQRGGSRALRRPEAWRKGRGKDNELTKEDRQQGKARRDMKSKENAEESKCNQWSLLLFSTEDVLFFPYPTWGNQHWFSY